MNGIWTTSAPKFVVGDDLVYVFVTRALLESRGRITCRHGLFVDVRKTLEMDVRRRTWTNGYSYHAGLIGTADRPILRYDKVHTHPGHPDAHHKLVFDHRTWRQSGSPQWVGYDRWPHLSEALEVVHDW